MESWKKISFSPRSTDVSSTEHPCCILYPPIYITNLPDRRNFGFQLLHLWPPWLFSLLNLAWVNIWLCPLSHCIPLCNLINPFISLAPVYPMFWTNSEWISKKKKEEHVHNHRHLLTCLQQATWVLQDRKIPAKNTASHLSAIFSVHINFLN